MRIKNIVASALLSLSLIFISTGAPLQAASALNTIQTTRVTSTFASPNIGLPTSSQTSDSLSSFAGGPATPTAGIYSLYGYGWSSNIGWISLSNCTDPAVQSTCSGIDYGVTMPLNGGALSGYGWSPNIGWVNFDGGSVSWNSDGSGAISGWAQACDVYVTGCSGSLKSSAELGGYDGKISLSGASAGGYGVKISATGNTVSGFAWGSIAIGWIDFKFAFISRPDLTPTLTLLPNFQAITPTTSAHLTWASTNTSSCPAATPVGWPSSSATSGTKTISGLAVGTYTYSITCNTLNSSTITATATIQVTDNPSGLCPDGTPIPPSGVCSVTITPGGTINPVCFAPRTLDPIKHRCVLKPIYNEN